ncbi:Gpi1-domain-containing protein, partial [Vararia minispora EC-137]
SSFGNALWLILNDLVLGVIIGGFIAEHRAVLGSALGSVFLTIFVDFVRQVLFWLDSWPAGLKLNTELSHFLCKVLMTVTDLWADAVQTIAPHLPSLIQVVGFLAFGGLTLAIALSLDVLALLTLPATLNYRMLISILKLQFSALSSLWNLFQGKRYNMLHRHVDSFDYELDQLLLGTLLFTLLTFTVPTFIAYALLFIFMRMLVVSATFAVRLLLQAMNGFPLFALLLRIKDPRRIPG